MPTIMTHAAVAAALTTVAPVRHRRRSVTALAAGLAILPDADIVAFWLHPPHGSMWGHRGVTHSLFAAAVVGTAVALLAYGRAALREPVIVSVLFLSMASHGVLDAFTNGGSGVAFFAPFDSTRYFFPWRPIEVSPLVDGFFTRRGLRVLASELRWIGIPTLTLAIVAMWARRRWRRGPS